MKLKTLIQSITIAAILVIVFNSCAKEQAITADNFDNVANVEQIRQDVETTLTEIQSLQESPSLEQRSHCDGRIVVVRANSHNALKEAIHRAGEGGIVYLKAGVHTETEPITINHRINIVGANGSVLKIKSPTTPYDNGIMTLKPGLHFYNAPHSLIKNIEIQPYDENGGTAVLFENSNHGGFFHNKTQGFQFSVIVEKSNHTTIVGNRLVSNTLWQNDLTIECDAILNTNGLYTYIANNDISNAVSGTFSSDLYGTFSNNTLKNNFIGIILCKFPAGTIKLPSGELTGAKKSCGYWKVTNNNSTDNLNAGYLVVDGANNNVLNNNQAARNGTYDIELVGESYRFGFFTPKSFSNKVVAGRYSSIRIKDCGENNTVVGGVKVDTGSDPCN
jgi:hypothetical protein